MAGDGKAKRTALFVGMLFVLVVVAISIPRRPLAHWHDAHGNVYFEEEPGQEIFHRRVMEGMTLVWIFAIGAAVGSFLNVVIYRLPLGEDLVLRPSRCPKCQTNIRPQDNIPVLGWFLLGGKCRACGLAISPRYVLVEATIGALLVFLVWMELIRGGANLPNRIREVYDGIPWMVWSMRAPDLMVITMFHFLILTTLYAWTMIRLDGHPPQRKLAAFALLLAGLVCFFPWIHPIPVSVALLVAGSPAWMFGILGFFAGVLIPALLAFVLTRLTPWYPADRFEFGALAAVVGAAFGWQSAVLVTLVVFLVNVGVRMRLKQPGDVPAGIDRRAAFCVATWLLTVLVLIIFWRPIGHFLTRISV